MDNSEFGKRCPNLRRYLSSLCYAAVKMEYDTGRTRINSYRVRDGIIDNYLSKYLDLFPNDDNKMLLDLLIMNININDAKKWKNFGIGSVSKLESIQSELKIKYQSEENCHKTAEQAVTPEPVKTVRFIKWFEHDHQSFTVASGYDPNACNPKKMETTVNEYIHRTGDILVSIIPDGTRGVWAIFEKEQ